MLSTVIPLKQMIKKGQNGKSLNDSSLTLFKFSIKFWINAFSEYLF